MEQSPPGVYTLKELVTQPLPTTSSTTSTTTSTTTLNSYFDNYFFTNHNGYYCQSIDNYQNHYYSSNQEQEFEPSNLHYFSNNSLIDLLTLPQDSTTFDDDLQYFPPLIPFDNNTLFPDNTNAIDDGVFGGQIGHFDQNLDHHYFSSGFDTTKVKLEQHGINNNNNNNVGIIHKQCKSKNKVEGQPSKNLMAERRRRKRLNDRLSMLRSIVPKISKMDRTSILGDTIDYMKELLDKVDKLRQNNNKNMEEDDDEDEDDDKSHMKWLASNTRELKSNEAIVRNPPKFDVERGDVDTRIGICCATKPGLLLSTMTTLEALGLDIHQCVISCFNDFSFQASCSEATEHRAVLSPEDVKQELFKTAGYGGRCV